MATDVTTTTTTTTFYCPYDDPSTITSDTCHHSITLSLHGNDNSRERIITIDYDGE